MATFCQSTKADGSDSLTDFCCSPCLEHKIDKFAEIYCDNCLKFFCAKCIKMHSQLFSKHVTYGRGDTAKWPVSKEVEDFLQQCDLHKEKHLELFCNEHKQLCCTNCVFLNHRHCSKVTLISESAEGPSPDLRQLSKTIKTVLVKLKKLQNKWDTNIESLQASYNKQLHKIHDTRQKINTILDEIEKNTVKELDDKMTILKASLKTDVDNCSKVKNELNRISDAMHDIVDKRKVELLFIASKKCLDKVKQSETYLKENSVKVESSLSFQANSDVQQYLSKLSGLGRIVLSSQALSVKGDPDQVFTVQGKSEYDMRIISDYWKLMKSFFTIRHCISAVCALPNDQILVADEEYERIKLLNNQYQVVGLCDLTGKPRNICQITASEVAISVNSNNNEVQFVSVNSGRLVMGIKLQFQHFCSCVAYNLQNLYITSSTALYKYSMSGDLLEKLYEDTSGCEGSEKVCACAVSPDGDKIFITNFDDSMVLTLARDGTILHTFRDRDLIGPQFLHVTALGQVLVCGSWSCKIIQLDGECRKKLATLVTRSDGLEGPVSVCFSKSTSSIIVSRVFFNTILVFKVK